MNTENNENKELETKGADDEILSAERNDGKHHHRHRRHHDDFAPIMHSVRKAPPKRTAITEAFDWLEIVVLSLAFVMIFFTYFGRLAVVQQTSMRCTLEPNDKLLISDFFYEPAQGDIVVFHAPASSNVGHNEPLIKRIIATGGQSVYIDFPNWDVYVYNDPDGKYKTLDDIKAAGIQPLEEIYIENNPVYEPEQVMQFAGRQYPVKLAEDEVFVMGDNRQVSSDSRTFGPIKESYLLGKVIVRLFPLSEFGGVY